VAYFIEPILFFECFRKKYSPQTLHSKPEPRHAGPGGNIKADWRCTKTLTGMRDTILCSAMTSTHQVEGAGFRVEDWGFVRFPDSARAWFRGFEVSGYRFRGEKVVGFKIRGPQNPIPDTSHVD
jgi:hypothetical protein